MTNLLEALLGKNDSPNTNFIENLSKSFAARKEWAELTQVQRMRTELAAASEQCAERCIAFDPLATARAWIAQDFPGVSLSEKEISGAMCWHITDGKEEFAFKSGLSEADDPTSRYVDLSRVTDVGELTWAPSYTD